MVPLSHPLASSGDGSAEDLSVAWQPTADQIESANVTKFIRHHGLKDLDELLERSARDPDWFYPKFLETIDFRWYEKYHKVVDLDRGIQWPRWFPGGLTNYVLNTIDKHIEAGQGDNIVLLWEGEDGTQRQWTYADLDREVRRLAAGLQQLGVAEGDRVGLFLPMVPETLASFMACARIGAIVTPIFSGFAPDAVVTRLQDSEAKVLITADGFYRRGRVVPMKETADVACQQAPTVKHVVVVKRIGRDIPWTDGRDIYYEQLLVDNPPDQPPVPLPADAPLLIIYTSGTTGRPKGTVLTQGGFPIKIALDTYFCFDMRSDDRILWVTDIGWLMGTWLFTAATVRGASLVMFEGTPDYPTPSRLWELVDRYQVTILGIAPTVVRALMAQGDEWVKPYNLSSLRILGSTGEAWNPKPWRWYLEQIGRGRCPVINYSGGTEISGGIVGCYPTMPLKPCAFHGPVPGIDADVYDQDGKPLRGGAVGELVVKNPWVGMTRSFWRDDDRYFSSYWSRWPDIWVHGDLAAIDDDGYWYILGRSDDTLMVAGKRIGPAEIESALASHPAVQESAAIGVPDPVKGEAIVVFVIAREGFSATPELEQELKNHATERLGRALQPSKIVLVKDLPRTRSAKVMRRLIRAKYLGRELGDVSSLENPEALDAIQPMA